LGVLETHRLLLRPFDESDAEAAHVWFSDPHVFRFYTYGPYASLGETAKRIGEYREQFNSLGYGKCAMVEKASGILIGDAGLMCDSDTGEIHVGYKLSRAYWGLGLATEAAREWVRFGFENLRLERIAAFIHPRNLASIRVVQKLGFSFCKYRREAGIDWSIYELLKP